MKVEDSIGKTQESVDVVAWDAIARFRATFDLDGSAPGVRYGSHRTLCVPTTSTSSLSEDGHPARGDFFPPITLPRRMWAASEIDFLSQLVLGDPVRRVSTIANVYEKQGTSGSLVFVLVEHVTWCGDRHAIRERQSIVYRETAAQAAVLPADGCTPPSGRAQWDSLRPRRELLMRYSALTFNSHRIHYDYPYARDVEGYPDLVVHGPLTATLLLHHLAATVSDRRITRFSFRAIAPAYAEQELHFAARPAGDDVELLALGNDGREVMRGAATLV